MRTQNIFAVLLLLLLSFTKLQAQTATGAPDPTGATNIGSTLTVKQAVDIAIKNNLVINQADLQSQTYKVAFDQSWEYMLPTLGITGSEGINFGRSLNTSNYTYVNAQTGTGNYNLNANLPIFQGLQLQNAVKQNRYVYQASRLDLQFQKDNITLSVLTAYLLVLSNRDQLATILAQQDADTVQLHRLENQNREGALLVLSNLTDLQGQVAQDLINIATATNNLESSKVNLFQLLNVPYKRDVQYENSVNTADIADYQASSDSIYQSALRIVPNIQSSDLKVKGFEKALAVARGAYLPTLSFSGNVNSYFNGAATAPNTTNKIDWGTQFKDNRSEYIGLNLSVPILNGFRVRNNVRNAKINLQNSRLTANNTRLALQQSVELAFQNMIAAYKQYKFYNDQAIAYAESFRITNIRFTEGVITADVYILAKARTDQAATNLAAAKYAYIFRTKVLDYYQGRLSIP
ncbi:MAG TPA: TolC family protein [Puia sp.]|jgi:outer membrane protein